MYNFYQNVKRVNNTNVQECVNTIFEIVLTIEKNKIYNPKRSKY